MLNTTEVSMGFHKPPDWQQVQGHVTSYQEPARQPGGLNQGLETSGKGLTAIVLGVLPSKTCFGWFELVLNLFFFF